MNLLRQSIYVALAISLSACVVVQPTPAKTAVGGGSSGGGGGGGAGSTEDLGSVPCSTNLQSVEPSLKGDSFTVICPSGCNSGAVYGTGHYTADSSICVSAIHAGAIEVDKGGPVKVTVGKGFPHFRGTRRHGVSSSDWGRYDKTYSFTDFPGDEAENSKVSCSHTPNSLGKDAGDTFTANCPDDCTTGALWGTDAYTTDSSICLAAVHAGVIKPGRGGSVTVKVVSGRPAYTGSKRNGVTSSDWGTFNESFSVE